MKRNYMNPTSETLEMSVEHVIATSGDAGGTVNPMPWGSNKRDSDDVIWNKEESSKHNVW